MKPTLCEMKVTDDRKCEKDNKREERKKKNRWFLIEQENDVCVCVCRNNFRYTVTNFNRSIATTPRHSRYRSIAICNSFAVAVPLIFFIWPIKSQSDLSC